MCSSESEDWFFSDWDAFTSIPAKLLVACACCGSKRGELSELFKWAKPCQRPKRKQAIKCEFHRRRSRPKKIQKAKPAFSHGVLILVVGTSGFRAKQKSPQ